jgi:hypothetical protein
MWFTSKPVADKRVAFAAGQASTYHFESLATRRNNLQTMASVAVDLAAVKGSGPSSELKSLFESFIQRHGEQNASDVVAATVANHQELLANPHLQKHQKQARQQPIVGPTTKTAGNRVESSELRRKRQRMIKKRRKLPTS